MRLGSRAVLFLSVLSVLALVASPAGASHSEQGTYIIGTTPGLSVVCSPDCLGEPGLNIGGYTFVPELDEAPVSAAFADNSGGPVSFTVCQDFNDALCGEAGEPRVAGCGTTADLTTSAQAFRPGTRVSVFIRLVSPDCVGGLGLGGTITLTYGASPAS